MADVFFDSWAWMEILRNTPRGKALHAKYRGRIHTGAMALAEVGSKVLRTLGRESAIEVVTAMEAEAKAVHPVTVDDAKGAVTVHAELRARDASASLADAIHLCMARRVGLPLLSHDAAFKGEPDVIGT